MPSIIFRVFNVVLFIIISLVLIFTPLAFGTVSNWSQLVFLKLALAAATLWLLIKLFRRRVLLLYTPLHLPIFFILILFCLHSFFSPAAYVARRQLWLFAAYTGIFIILTDILRTRKRLFFLLTLIFFLVLVFSIYGLVANRLWPDIVYGLGPVQKGLPGQVKIPAIGMSFFPRVKPELYSGRVDAPYLCPDHLAGYLELVLPFLLSLVVIVPLSMVLKIWLLYFSLIIFTAFVFTLSRGGWLSFIVGMAVFWKGEIVRRLPSFFWRNAFLVALIILVAAAGFGIRPVRERVVESFGGKEAAIRVRLRIWEGTVRMIKARPLLGWGLGTFRWVYPCYRHRFHYREANFAHNDYLHIWAELGLVGLLLFLWLALSALKLTFGKRLRKLPRRYRAVVVGLRISLIVFLVHSFFDFNLHIPANAVLLVALTGLGLAALQRGLRPFRSIRFECGTFGKIIYRSLGVLILALIVYSAGNKLFRAQRAEAFFLRAKYGQGRLEWREADRLLGRAIEEDPENPFLYALRGKIRGAIFRWSWRDREEYFQKAIRSYGEALSRNPYWADLLAERGRLFQTQGSFAAAEKDFRAALNLDPQNAFYHDLLGILYGETGRIAEARAQFKKALEIAPHDTLAIRQLEML